MITTFEKICVLKNYVIVLRKIFDKTYKGKKQAKIYMWDLHHKLFLFQQSRNCFSYLPENGIKWDILNCTTFFIMEVKVKVFFQSIYYPFQVWNFLLYRMYMLTNIYICLEGVIDLENIPLKSGVVLVSSGDYNY